MNNKNLAPKLTYLRKLYAPWQFTKTSLKPDFHYTANATTTTQKRSDYKVEQSSFTLIALFWVEIGRCRGRNWLKAWFPLGLVSIKPISTTTTTNFFVKTKRLVGRMTAQPHDRFVFVSWSCILLQMETRLKINYDHDTDHFQVKTKRSV